jgi:hypothetical protein
MLERTLQVVRTPVNWSSRSLLRRVPWAVVILLIPSWISYGLIDERDDYDTENLLYYYVPDITEDQLALVVAILITPVINTEGDQILLVTGLIGIFGTMINRKLGTPWTLAIFWGTTTAGALMGGILLHFLHPHFAHYEPIREGMERVFNGGSAGGFGFVGAYAATGRWTMLWGAVFLAWEPTFWATISRDYTSVFHLIAFLTGFGTMRFWLRGKIAAREREQERHERQREQLQGQEVEAEPG